MVDFIYYLSYLPMFIGFSIFLIISVKVLSRNPKNRLNQIFTCISILCLTYLVIYLIDDILAAFSTTINHSLIYLVALYFLLLVSGFILLYLSVLYKPDIMNKVSNQILLILVHVCIFLIIFIIPDGAVITRFPSGQLSYPKYSDTFTIFLVVIALVSLIIGSLMSIQIRKNLSEPDLKGKFKGIIAGVVVYYSLLLRNIICYYIGDATIRNITEIASISLIIASILLYFTLGKGLKK